METEIPPVTATSQLERLAVGTGLTGPTVKVLAQAEDMECPACVGTVGRRSEAMPHYRFARAPKGTRLSEGELRAV